MASRIQIRRDTAANWTSANPALLAGELCYETDSGRMKIGTGANWSSTDYFVYEDTKLAELLDVTITGAAAGDFLRYNNSSSVWYNDAINLATDTIGNYVESLVAGTGLTITNNSGEGSTPTIAVSASAYDVYGSASAAYNAANSYTNGVVDALTSDTIEEGSFSLYFTNQRALNATALTYDLVGSAASAEFNAVGQAQDYTDGRFTALTTLYVPEEGTNRYFTNLRAINAASATYDAIGAASTAYTNAVAYADGLTTTDIAEGTSLYFTDERAQDAVGNAVGTGLTYTDGTGAVAVNTSVIQARVANVTDTEIGYLDGVTSAIQTQIDTKAPLASPTFTGTVAGITATMVGLGSVNNTADTAKPVSTAQQTALDLKANLASPTFTGTPTAPTAAAGNNSTQIATTAYADAAVAALVGTAGATLDTLGEIATALGNDANLSATLTTSIGLKAPLASPTFTGTVSGITATMVGLGSVDNTADTAKPVSTAQQTALDLKANLASPTFTGTVSGITATMVGLGSVNNTADTAKPVSTAQQTALDLKANLNSPTFTGTVTLPNNTVALGTQTTGNYMLDVSAGTGLTVSHTQSEGSTATVSLDATLDNLSNVTAPSPSDGQFLKYVSASTAWVPAAIPTINALDDIGNVNAPSPSDGEFLKYVSASTAWVPAAIPTINALDDIGNVSASTPSSGQFLKWNGTAWVADSIPTINALDDIGDVAAPSPTTGEVLLWNGTAWVDSNVVRDNLVRFYMEVM